MGHCPKWGQGAEGGVLSDPAYAPGGLQGARGPGGMPPLFLCLVQSLRNALRNKCVVNSIGNGPELAVRCCPEASEQRSSL